MHRDGAGTVLRIPGKAGDSWPLFFFAVVTKTGARWLVFSGGRVGEFVETVVWSWLVGTQTLNYCKISVE